MIPFNKPYLTGKEAHYMYQAVYTGKLSGNVSPLFVVKREI